MRYVGHPTARISSSGPRLKRSAPRSGTKVVTSRQAQDDRSIERSGDDLPGGLRAQHVDHLPEHLSRGATLLGGQHGSSINGYTRADMVSSLRRVPRRKASVAGVAGRTR